MTSKPTSLVDEIMEMVCELYMYGPRLPTAKYFAVQDRLQSLGSELNDLRNLVNGPPGANRLTWRLEGGCQAIPEGLEQLRGLPCSNVSDWDNEEGG